MKSVTTLCLLLLASSNAALAAPSPAGAHVPLTELLKQPQPMVVAHRGCFEFGPENSLQAIKACFNMAVGMAECDLRTTKDGVLVLMHDATLDRTTNFSGVLKNYTYPELERARLRQGAGGIDAPITEETIPRFADALKVSKHHIFLLLHVKEQNYDQIFHVVEANGAQSRVVFLTEAAPNTPQLRNARFLGKSAFIPIVPQCLVVKRNADCYNEDTLGQAFTDFRSLVPVAYLPAFDGNAFLAKSAAAIRRSGVKIMGSSEEPGQLQDPDALWGPLLRMHVSLILTDHASELTEYLKARGAR